MNLGLKYVVGDDGKKHLTIADDRRAAAIAFVQGNAAKSPPEIEAVVQEGHDALLAALDGLSEAQAQYKPSADDWCVLELMAHVVTTKRVFASMCENLSAGHWPPGVGEEWQEESRQDGVTLAKFETLADALAAAQSAHDDLLKHIRALDTANTEIRFRHFVFGDLNSREWAVFQRIHDGDHTPQIGSIRASSGFPGA